MLHLKRSQRRSTRYNSFESNGGDYLERSTRRSESDDSSSSLLECNPSSLALGKWIQGQECADCTAEETEWVALPWGVPLCLHCARSHRKLDKGVSRVRNVFQADWTERQVNRIQSLGGSRSINSRLERFLERWRKPSHNCSSSVRTCFIRDKYKDMLFCDPEERRSAVTSNEDIKQLAQFVSKLASRRRREIDFETFTETLGMLVHDALRQDAFSRGFLKLLIRLGWSLDGGYFSRTFSYDDIIDLNDELISCGYSSDRAEEVERSRFDYCDSPRNSPSRRHRRKSRSCRSPKQRKCDQLDFSDDEKLQVVRSKNRRQKRHDYEDDEKREVIRYRKGESFYKRRYADEEEGNEDDTRHFRVKIYDDALGFGVGQHRWGGVEVTWVKPNSEAWSCGIRKGDVIVAINHEDIRDIRSLKFVCELLEEGRPLSLRVKRVKRRSP